jgi:hypothetical protein
MIAQTEPARSSLVLPQIDFSDRGHKAPRKFASELEKASQLLGGFSEAELERRKLLLTTA